MSSSGSSSSSRLAVGLLAALLSLACHRVRPEASPVAAPGTPPAEAAAWRTFEAERDVVPAPPPALPPAAPERPLALFPVQNVTGGAAPVKELTAALRARLTALGVALVPEEQVQRTLAERRVRYLGGLDRATAEALRVETGAEAVLIPSLEAWLPVAPFRVALTTRLVTTERAPVITWIGAVARTGTDAPGLLGLGIVPAVEVLRDRALEETAQALAAALRHPRGAPAPCPDRRGRAPVRAFHSPLLVDANRETIALLPLVNATLRRDAGEVLLLRLLAPLVADGTVHVIEPGVVRTEMLNYRLGAGGGISLDDARIILKTLDADLILAGTVRTFEEAVGTSGTPAVDFSAWVLDRETEQLVWSSTSSALGDDGVFFFGAGRVTTASGLACTLAKGTVRDLLRGRSPLVGPPPDAGIARPAGPADVPLAP